MTEHGRQPDRPTTISLSPIGYVQYRFYLGTKHDLIWN